MTEPLETFTHSDPTLLDPTQVAGPTKTIRLPEVPSGEKVFTSNEVIVNVDRTVRSKYTQPPTGPALSLKTLVVSGDCEMSTPLKTNHRQK
ncbi:hypothetical protein LBMAG49_27780 [Planctomycetota bacterium]|nr:hypothetical protein LBMAG49_27780 [Planctomycetota bacterium]